MGRLATLLLATAIVTPPVVASETVMPQDTLNRVLNDFHVGHVRSKVAVSRIGALGAGAISESISVLRAGSFQGPAGDADPVLRPVGDAHEGLLLRGLAELPFDAVRGEIEAVLVDGSGPGDRVLAAQVLAHTGPPADLPWLAEILTDDQPASLRALRGPMAEMTALWLERDPRALRRVPAFFDAVNPRLLRSALTGVRESGSSPEVLHALAQCLGQSSAVDALILVEIAGEARTTRRPVRPDTLALVRPSLTAADRRVRLEGVLAAGHLDDVTAIPVLIEMLSEPDKSLRTRAREALERSSRERLGAEHEVWDRWYRGVEEWRIRSLPPLLTHLASTDAEKSRRALLEIARHRVFRYELVGHVASALGDADDGTAEIACAVLGHFACEEGLPALVDALGHPAVDVRKAALQALRRATGATIGEDPAHWRAAGFGVKENRPR